jgi:hypothetical protein
MQCMDDSTQFSALAHLASLMAVPKPKARCLFIGPMKGAESATRDRFEALYEDIVQPAAVAVGMDPQSALADSSGMITPNIFRSIRHSQVIVADMTGDNTCVGYELAFAHSLARCTVLMLRDRYKIPFDLKDMNHIKFDPYDAASMRQAKEQMKSHLKDFSKMGWVSANNPLFHAAYAPPEDARIHVDEGLHSLLAGYRGTGAGMRAPSAWEAAAVPLLGGSDGKK